MMPTYIAYASEISSAEDWYYLELCENYEGFRILLQNSHGQVVRVSFESVYLYMRSDEGKRFCSLEHLPKVERSYIYEVQHSDLLAWFHKENLNLQFKDVRIFHWAIVTPHEWVDVLSVDMPVIERL